MKRSVLMITVAMFVVGGTASAGDIFDGVASHDVGDGPVDTRALPTRPDFSIERIQSALQGDDTALDSLFSISKKDWGTPPNAHGYRTFRTDELMLCEQAGQEIFTQYDLVPSTRPADIDRCNKSCERLARGDRKECEAKCLVIGDDHRVKDILGISDQDMLNAGFHNTTRRDKDNAYDMTGRLTHRATGELIDTGKLESISYSEYMENFLNIVEHLNSDEKRAFLYAIFEPLLTDPKGKASVGKYGAGAVVSGYLSHIRNHRLHEFELRLLISEYAGRSLSSNIFELQRGLFLKYKVEKIQNILHRVKGVSGLKDFKNVIKARAYVHELILQSPVMRSWYPKPRVITSSYLVGGAKIEGKIEEAGQ